MRAGCPHTLSISALQKEFEVDNFSPIFIRDVVVFTDKQVVAEQAAEIIDRERLADKAPDGTLLVFGHNVRWASRAALRQYDAWQ